MKFTLGTGFYKDRQFTLDYWIPNVIHHCHPQPESIVSVCVGGTDFPWRAASVSEIKLTGNLGHIGALLNGKDREFCGWSAAVLSLALLAYSNETDLIYLESDCLAFGPWVEQCYKDMGDGDMVFGHKQESYPWMECSQSLFLVRHRFIPYFVAEYLTLGDERHLNNNGHHDNLPERKFVKIETKFGSEKVKRLSFGVDRCRPLPVQQPVWYAQRFTPEELNLIKEKGLL